MIWLAGVAKMHKMIVTNFWGKLIQLMFIWSHKTTCISQCWFGWRPTV